jgi:hypothetical protein
MRPEDTPPPLGTAPRSLADYAIGNAVPGGLSPVTGVGQALASRILALVPNMPPDVAARFQIISGERDAARQAQVNSGVTNSRHMHGMAVDLQNDPAVIQWITQHPQYGVGFPLTYMGPKEYNHMEMIDPTTGQRVGMDYAATGDPNFKTGLRLPTAPSPDIGGTAGFGVASANLPSVDVPAPAPAQAPAATLSPELLTQLAGGGFNPPGLSSLAGTMAGAAQAQQPFQAPQPILQNPGAPLPISQRLL